MVVVKDFLLQYGHTPDHSQFPTLATIDISFENCQNTASKHNVSITTLL